MYSGHFKQLEIQNIMITTAEKIQALNSLTEEINPTIIYNEGWMIRLLVIESMIEKLKIKDINFGLLASKKWSSEALIASPFIDTKENREGYTHADLIMGDFSVNYEARGEVILDENPEVLGIIEAKMGSNLSQGTSNAKDIYNQASRNVCCLSYVTKNNPICELFFVVSAPNATIKKHEIERQVKRENILEQIENRFKHSKETYKPEIKKQVEKCKLVIISYGEWIAELQNIEVQKMLGSFYNECLKYNKIKDY